MRIRRKELLRLAIEIGEIATSSPGDQNFFANAIRALKYYDAPPALAGLDRAEEPSGARAQYDRINFSFHIVRASNKSSPGVAVSPAEVIPSIFYSAHQICRLDIDLSPCDIVYVCSWTIRLNSVMRTLTFRLRAPVGSFEWMHSKTTPSPVFANTNEGDQA